jgi:hypothetical protein
MYEVHSAANSSVSRSSDHHEQPTRTEYERQERGLLFQKLYRVIHSPFFFFCIRTAPNLDLSGDGNSAQSIRYQAQSTEWELASQADVGFLSRNLSG